jgi:hypothetical protein
MKLKNQRPGPKGAVELVIKIYIHECNGEMKAPKLYNLGFP